MFDTINRISIKVTDFCNLDCVYCHQQQKVKDETSEFKYFDKLESFIESLPLAEAVDVLVTGGEISIKLHLFEKVEKILRRIERKRDVQFIMSVISNGTNMQGLIDIVNDGRMKASSVSFSWDGIHSYTESRKGKLPNLSDEYFNNNIPLIVKHGYAHSINVAFAITPTTITSLVDSLRFCLDSGLRNFSFYYIHEANYTDPEFIENYRTALEKVAQIFVGTYHDVEKRFRYYNWQNMYCRYKASDASMFAKTSCVKLGNSIHIDIDGAVYPCTFFSDHRSMQIGHILEGFYQDRINAFTEEYFTEPSCDMSSCKNEHCFECPASNYILNKGLNNRTMNLCHLLSIEREIFMRYFDMLHISPYDALTFWNVGTSVIESHIDNKRTSICHLPIIENPQYKYEDEMLVSDNIEVVQSW